MRRFLRKNFLVEATDILSNKCRHLYHGNKQTSPLSKSSQPQSTQSSSSMPSPPSVPLPIHRTPSSHAYCFICKRPGPKLVVVPFFSRFYGSRCCPSHIIEGEFVTGTLDNLQTFDSSLFNRKGILESYSQSSKLCH